MVRDQKIVVDRFRDSHDLQFEPNFAGVPGQIERGAHRPIPTRVKDDMDIVAPEYREKPVEIIRGKLRAAGAYGAAGCRRDIRVHSQQIHHWAFKDPRQTESRSPQRIHSPEAVDQAGEAGIKNSGGSAPVRDNCFQQL